MSRPKGCKLTQEHKDKLRASAIKYRDEKRKLEENVGENVKPDNKNDARENGDLENNISGSENDDRTIGGGSDGAPASENLEIEKGELAKMEIPTKIPEKIEPEVFTCANCQGNLSMGTKFCPHCGCQLDWSVAS